MANDEPQPPNYIGSAEVCRRWNIDRSTLTRWIHLGRVTPVTQLGPEFNRAYLWDPAYVDQIAKAGGPPEVTDRPRWQTLDHVPYDARDIP